MPPCVRRSQKGPQNGPHEDRHDDGTRQTSNRLGRSLYQPSLPEVRKHDLVERDGRRCEEVVHAAPGAIVL